MGLKCYALQCTCIVNGKKTPRTAPSLVIATLLEEDQASAIGNMHRKMVKIARVILEISSWTDRHTHTDILITILHNCSRG